MLSDSYIDRYCKYDRTGCTCPEPRGAAESSPWGQMRLNDRAASLDVGSDLVLDLRRGYNLRES